LTTKEDSMQRAQESVRSADGTRIAVDRSGSGPAVVMIDPAGGYSGFDAIRGLGRLLAEDFTVHAYDRRGRGDSGDEQPYAVEREVEDLAAVIDAAGGSALVYGFSSGALLALLAAAAGVPIARLALFEPPVRGEGEPPDTAFRDEIAELVASGRRAAAVEHFLSATGVPAEIIEQMAPTRPALEAVAHTLVYDCEISNATTFDLLRSVRTPALVIDSRGSSDDLTSGTAAIAGALPNGALASLSGGWHGVPDEDLATVVAGFFRG
jgi:pimeloyl-ACP methyl ester carboxylesterase